MPDPLKRKLNTFVLLAPILSIGVYFYLTHLQNVMPLEPDENRAYHFTYYSPQVYLVCSFFTHLFQNYDAPYYVMGAAGLLNIVLLYFLLRRISSGQHAFYGALFLSVYDYALRGSKILAYPPFFVLSMLLYCHTIFSAPSMREIVYRRLIFLAAGAMLGFLFTVNPSSYAVIAGLLAATFYFMAGEEALKSRREKTGAFVSLGLGALLFYAAFESAVYLKFDAATRATWLYKSYVAHILHYQSQTEALIDLTGPKGLTSFLKHFWAESIRQSPQNAYKTLFIGSFSALGAVMVLRNGNRKLKAVLLAAAVSFGLILALSLLKIHVIHEKAFLWSVFPVAALVGQALSGTFGSRDKFVRGGALLMSAVFFVFSFMQCVQITRSMPHLDDMLAYLRERGIAHREITTLFPINRYENFKNRDTTILIPVEPNPRIGEASRSHVLINWPAVYQLHQKFGIHYFLSSGMSIEAEIGENDLLLKHVEPLKTWHNHPMNNPYLNYPPENYEIKLYALKDIFDYPPNKVLLEKMYREGRLLYSRR